MGCEVGIQYSTSVVSVAACVNYNQVSGVLSLLVWGRSGTRLIETCCHNQLVFLDGYMHGRRIWGHSGNLTEIAIY